MAYSFINSAGVQMSEIANPKAAPARSMRARRRRWLLCRQFPVSKVAPGWR